jgi:hypothetical protein
MDGFQAIRSQSTAGTSFLYRNGSIGTGDEDQDRRRPGHLPMAIVQIDAIGSVHPALCFS